MRIALAGKGGSGKTTISAALARLWRGEGRPVVAIDGDSNPNLSAALGVDPDVAAGLRPLPAELVSRRLNGGPALAVELDEVLSRHAVDGPDGIRVLMMGMPAHAEEGCLCAAHAVASAVMADLGARPDTVALLDLEASPEHFSRGTTRHADVLVLVTEPYWRSLETTRRMAELAAELPIPRVVVVPNKVRRPTDLEAITDFAATHGLRVLPAVPLDDAVMDADVAGVSLLDSIGTDHPVSAALRALRSALTTIHVGRQSPVTPH